MSLTKSVDNILDCGWWVRFDRGLLYSADKDDLFVMDRKTDCEYENMSLDILKLH